MNKRLRSPQNAYHWRQEKKFITSKDLDKLSEEKMRLIYDKTRKILFNGANPTVASEPQTDQGVNRNLDNSVCCARFSVLSPVADANGNSEMYAATCSFCDKRVCNNCCLNCAKCYKLFCSHCCIPNYSSANTTHICHGCYH